jgi:uncharacterized membrane protein
MTLNFTDALFIATALGTGLIAGAFYAFSSFIMRALGQLTGRDGLVAMQAINVAAVTPLFMLGFIATALLSIIVLVVALAQRDAAGTYFAVAGAALYLVGCFGLTVTRNVPLNNALVNLDPTAPASIAQWNAYLTTWTTWNHIRTVAALLAMLAFLVALIARAAQS